MTDELRKVLLQGDESWFLGKASLIHAIYQEAETTDISGLKPPAVAAVKEILFGDAPAFVWVDGRSIHNLARVLAHPGFRKGFEQKLAEGIRETKQRPGQGG